MSLMILTLLLHLFMILKILKNKILLSTNIGISFCKVLFINPTGTSSPQIGGANAIVIIFNDV
jgi:hypothetical protein